MDEELAVEAEVAARAGGEVTGDDVTGDDAAVAEERPVSPGDALRSLPIEAERRGTRFVSAQAMQARLFSVYDAAAAAEGALSLVQSQLTLTLDRSYYDADEIEQMARQLDSLLALETLDLPTKELLSEDLMSEDLVSED